MKPWQKILLIITLLVVYLFSVNLFATGLGNLESYEGLSEDNYSGNSVKIGFGDSVDVSLKRKKVYGHIIISGDKEYLYLLGIVKLPGRINGFNFYFFHILVIIILFLIALLPCKKTNKNIYKERLIAY